MRLFGTIDGEVTRRDRSAALTPPFDFFASGYLFYRGVGLPANIDYSTPVGYAPPGATQIAIHDSGISPGRRVWFGLRAVSSSQLEETNCHVVACAELDAGDALLPAPLDLATDLSATVLADGSVALGFTYRPQAGYAAAETFEVFTDGGTGVFDLESPVASLAQVASDQAEFEVVLAAPTLPGRIAVRPSNDCRVGQLSRALHVATPPDLIPPSP